MSCPGCDQWKKDYQEQVAQNTLDREYWRREATLAGVSMCILGILVGVLLGAMLVTG